MHPEYGETWVYESLVSAIPGLHLSARTAIALQIVVFEAAVLVVAAVYGLWAVVLPATVAIAVAGVGSWLMLRFSRRIREVETPEPYRRLLFGSSAEVALSVLAFVLLVTYLFVVDPERGGSALVSDLLGPDPPPVAVALLLVIAWDVVYRIGTCWWATVVGFWRATQYGFDADRTRKLGRIDALNLAFATLQVLLVPVVLDQLLLVVAVGGHLVAVVVVATSSILLQRSKASGTPE
jgi:hypothetical protein